MSRNPNTELAVHAIRGGMPVKEAAEAAGVHRTTLWRALKKAKQTTDQLERVRGSRKLNALEMLLGKQMELIFNALERLPPEELDKQGAPFLKDLMRVGTVNMGILLDKITKHEEKSAGGDNEVIVRIEGMPSLPKSAISVLSGQPVESISDDHASDSHHEEDNSQSPI